MAAMPEKATTSVNIIFWRMVKRLASRNVMVNSPEEDGVVSWLPVIMVKELSSRNIGNSLVTFREILGGLLDFREEPGAR
jgi:hypothetical protein